MHMHVPISISALGERARASGTEVAADSSASTQSHLGGGLFKVSHYASLSPCSSTRRPVTPEIDRGPPSCRTIQSVKCVSQESEERGEEGGGGGGAWIEDPPPGGSYAGANLFTD